MGERAGLWQTVASASECLTASFRAKKEAECFPSFFSAPFRGRVMRLGLAALARFAFAGKAHCTRIGTESHERCSGNQSKRFATGSKPACPRPHAAAIASIQPRKGASQSL